MNEITFIMNPALWDGVKGGFTALIVFTAAVILISAVFTAKEFKKAGRKTDAREPAVDNGKMPDSDNTD